MGRLIANDNYMDASKKFVKDSGLTQKISFKDGSVHTVKLIKDKEDVMQNAFGGGTSTGIKYLVEENGEQKTFFTGAQSLISKLADKQPGETVTIQMKNRNGKSYFVVSSGTSIDAADDEQGDEEDTSAAPSANVEW